MVHHFGSQITRDPVSDSFPKLGWQTRQRQTPCRSGITIDIPDDGYLATWSKRLAKRTHPVWRTSRNAERGAKSWIVKDYLWSIENQWVENLRSTNDCIASNVQMRIFSHLLSLGTLLHLQWQLLRGCKIRTGHATTSAWNTTAGYVGTHVCICVVYIYK